MNDTQQKLTPELVSMAIEAGMLDASLPALRDIINERLDVLATRAAGQLDAGTRFRIKDCRPKKWNGVLVEFKKHDGIWLVCHVVHSMEASRLGEHVVRLRNSHVGTIEGA